MTARAQGDFERFGQPAGIIIDTAVPVADGVPQRGICVASVTDSVNQQDRLAEFGSLVFRRKDQAIVETDSHDSIGCQVKRVLPTARCCSARNRTRQGHLQAAAGLPARDFVRSVSKTRQSRSQNIIRVDEPLGVGVKRRSQQTDCRCRLAVFRAVVDPEFKAVVSRAVLVADRRELQIAGRDIRRRDRLPERDVDTRQLQ